ncbi:hypothetical protein D3C75_672840 [compost metagenome]
MAVLSQANKASRALSKAVMAPLTQGKAGSAMAVHWAASLSAGCTTLAMKGLTFCQTLFTVPTKVSAFSAIQLIALPATSLVFSHADVATLTTDVARLVMPPQTLEKNPIYFARC